jgi:cysteinyl-tRNA synthetase
MSKSAGRFTVLDDIIAEGHDPLAFRYFTYLAHYRTAQDFRPEALAGAAARLKRVQETFAALPLGDTALPDGDTLARFRDALRDDLNAPQALAVVSEVVREDRLAPAVRRATLLAMNAVLPMGLESVEARVDEGPPPEVFELLEKRNAARRARDFAAADRLRDEIGARGYEIRDSAQGSTLVRR